MVSIQIEIKAMRSSGGSAASIAAIAAAWSEEDPVEAVALVEDIVKRP